MNDRVSAHIEYSCECVNDNFRICAFHCQLMWNGNTWSFYHAHCTHCSYSMMDSLLLHAQAKKKKWKKWYTNINEIVRHYNWSSSIHVLLLLSQLCIVETRRSRLWWLNSIFQTSYRLAIIGDGMQTHTFNATFFFSSHSSAFARFFYVTVACEPCPYACSHTGGFLSSQ